MTKRERARKSAGYRPNSRARKRREASVSTTVRRQPGRQCQMQGPTQAQTRLQIHGLTWRPRTFRPQLIVRLQIADRNSAPRLMRRLTDHLKSRNGRRFRMQQRTPVARGLVQKRRHRRRHWQRPLTASMWSAISGHSGRAIIARQPIQSSSAQRRTLVHL